MSDWWYNYQMEKDNETESLNDEYEPDRDDDSWYDTYLPNDLVISVDLAERSDINDLPR